MEDIFLRYAVQSDAGFLFELVNERECRKNSLNPKEITLESHMNWFHEILHSEKKKQYILMEGSKPVGQGRLESKGETCRISYSIIPERRGCGYGKYLIQLLNNAVIKDFPECVSCFGEVIPENIASQKIFMELGYNVEKRDNYFYCYKHIKYCEADQELIENRTGGYYS